MKHFASTHSHTQNSVREHTPIYDIEAYNQRQRRITSQKFRKNLLSSASFFCLSGLVFSMFFWGA